MTLFNFSPCSFSLANGDMLYRDIRLSLDSGLSALIGRNGIGKSLLAAQLAAQQPADCYLLPQLPPAHWQQLGIADLLGITDKLNALQQLANGVFQLSKEKRFQNLNLTTLTSLILLDTWILP